MTQNTDQERAEFEAWMRSDDESYRPTDDSMRIRRDRLVWQAARRSQLVDHIPDAGKMVSAPVQLPEPVAYLHECGKKPSLRTLEFSKVAVQLSAKGYKSVPLYTEHQFRKLLEAQARNPLTPQQASEVAQKLFNECQREDGLEDDKRMTFILGAIYALQYQDERYALKATKN